MKRRRIVRSLVRQKSDGRRKRPARVVRCALGGPGTPEGIAESPDRPAGNGERLAAILGNNRSPGVRRVPKRAEEIGLDNRKGAAYGLRCRRDGRATRKDGRHAQSDEKVFHHAGFIVWHGKLLSICYAP